MMLRTLLRKFLKSDEADKQAEVIKRQIRNQSSETTKKIDKMNLQFRKSTTYHIARAMGAIK